ncbi:MAG: flavin reductase family protein [Candidatus Heimdallarchaeaceae archaeon]
MKKLKEQISPYLYPNPALLISCKNKEEESIITISWAGTCCSDPPTVSIGVRPSRFSYDLIKQSKQFVINVPTADMLEQVKFCGTESGREYDKWKECHFTREKGREVEVPLIKECPINLECRVKDIIEIGAHHLFIAEIVALHVDEEWKKNRDSDMLTYSAGVFSKTIPL